MVGFCIGRMSTLTYKVHTRGNTTYRSMSIIDMHCGRKHFCTRGTGCIASCCFVDFNLIENDLINSIMVYLLNAAMQSKYVYLRCFESRQTLKHTS